MSFLFAGYGFVDFDSPAAAQKAVTALKSSGVQAQMAKVRTSKLFIRPALLSPANLTRHIQVNDPILSDLSLKRIDLWRAFS